MKAHLRMGFFIFKSYCKKIKRTNSIVPTRKHAHPVNKQPPSASLVRIISSCISAN